jgi:MoaA/NifB/PqqE/SkfB family radical SAM enzyme
MQFKNKLRESCYYTRLKITSKLIEIYAKITNKRFYCNALKGDSNYNITINSDLTVSCNCNDDYGLGKIGDLNEQSLEEIFSGDKADSFRNTLARGKLPIFNCGRCSDLRWTNKKISKSFIKDYCLPKKGIMIENTINCNLNCLSCDREKIYSFRTKRRMSLDDIKMISKCIKNNNIKYIYYFNLGEPFFSEEIKEELEIIKRINPQIKISLSTNGILVDIKEKKEAALILDRISFSIDGSTQKSVCKYQKGADFDKSYSNMKSLIKLRNSLNRKKPVIIWKYVLFRWNSSKNLILNAMRLAKKAEVDYLHFELTLSPLWGIDYKHYLRLGYLNKIGKFKNKLLRIKIE